MRQLDLRTKTLSRSTLRDLFSRLYAELSLVASYPLGSGAFPRFGAGHLGAEINTAIDGVDSAIAMAATMLGKSAPANGTRAFDFTTGSHDVIRLHAELDRLHGRIDALGKGSMNGAILPPFPYALHRTGSATYLNTAGSFTVAGDGVPRIGLPYVVRRNLCLSSEDFTQWSNLSATVAANQVQDPFNGMNGDLITFSATNGAIYKGAIPVTSGTYTLSFWATPGTATGVKLAVYNETAGTFIAENVAFTPGSDRQTYSFTVPVGCTSIRVYPVRNMTTIGTIGLYGVMVNEGSTALIYQPTNSTGVDLTNPLNGAGVVLEGQSTNLITNNKWEVGTTPWATANASLTRVTSLFIGKTYAIKAAYSAQYANLYIPVAWAASTLYTVSFRGTTTVSGIYYVQVNNTTIYSWYAVAGRVDDISFQYTSPGTPGTDIEFKTFASSNFGDVTIDGIQIEAGPFKTSLILTEGAAVTRNPDQCAVMDPHNLVKHSRDFLQTSSWSLIDAASLAGAKVAAPDGTITGQPLTFTAGGALDQLLQAVTGLTIGKTYCLSLFVKRQGATDQKFRLKSGFSTIAYTVDQTATAAWQRFSIVFTATGDGNFAIVPDAANEAAALYIWEAQINEGSMPGVVVTTQDTPIMPSGVTTDPAWSQNGRISFRAVAPVDGGVFPAGNNYRVFGTAWTLSLYRGAGNLYLYRSDNVGNHYSQWVTNLPADGLPHDYVIEWTNYVLNGVRFMWMRLYVDGTLRASRNVAAEFGAISWSSLAGWMLADGTVNATISRVVPEFLPIPAGATL